MIKIPSLDYLKKFLSIEIGDGSYLSSWDILSITDTNLEIKLDLENTEMFVFNPPDITIDFYKHINLNIDQS